MKRERLPDRRQSETKLLWHTGKKWLLSISRYDDGRPAEVFVMPPNEGGVGTSDIAAAARDACVVISIALQYGVPLGVLRDAVTRFDDKRPCSIAGRILDEI